MELFDHQERMLTFNECVPFSLNGSEPGTGKTFPAIRFLENIGGKSVVVAPAFLCFNWLKEIGLFSSLKAGIFKGDISAVGAMDVVLVSYARLAKLEPHLKQNKIAAMVFDEAHYLANFKTQRTKAAHHMIKNYSMDHVKLMTGTPMRNRVPELWSLLAILDYRYQNGFLKRYPNQWTFSQTFTHPIQMRLGSRVITKFEGARNLNLLRPWLHEYYIRFRRDEVLDLPGMDRQMIEVNHRDPKIDAELEVHWRAKELTGHVSTIKAANAMLKAGDSALLAKHEIAADQGPVIIFTDHIDAAAEILKQLTKAKIKCAKITGATDMKERNDIVEGFQAGKYGALVATIKAAGVGLTLTKAHVMIFNDRSWVPADNSQAEDRIQRIGQKSKCRIIDIVREGVDADINRQLRQKMSVINQTVEIPTILNEL